MAKYDDSTQRLYWKFTQQDVDSFRETARNAAVIPNGYTQSEEKWLLFHFESKLVQLCESVSEEINRRVHKYNERELASKGNKQLVEDINFHNATYTALIYFKRFYLKQSIVGGRMHPRHFILAAILLAGKVEEFKGVVKVPLGWLCEFCDVSSEHVLDAEFRLLEQISFQVLVFHGFLPLNSLINELIQKIKWDSSSLRSGHFKESILKEKPSVEQFLRRRSLELLKLCYYTDAVLIYSPGLLAMSCIVIAVIRPGNAPSVPDYADIKALKEQEIVRFVRFLPNFLKAEVGFYRAFEMAMVNVKDMLTKLPQRPENKERAAFLLKTANYKVR